MPPRRQNRQTTNSSTTKAREPTRRTRSQTRSVSAEPVPTRRQRATPLDSVPENAEIEHLNGSKAPAALDDSPILDDSALVRRPSPDSPSGSPTMTTFSQGELQNLDPDLIIESLPDLHQPARRLLDLLVRRWDDDDELEEHIRQLHDPNSKLTKLVNARSRSLDNVKDNTFGSQDYIVPTLILRSLLGTQNVPLLSTSLWRPDAIFYEANLANLVRQLCIMSADDDQILENLISLDNSFPGPFVSGFIQYVKPDTVGASAYLEEAYDLALEMRTQIAIKHVIRENPQTATQAFEKIRRIFVDIEGADPNSGVLNIEDYTRSWEGLPPSPVPFAPRIAQRVVDLTEQFDAFDMEPEEIRQACDDLAMEYSWSDFQSKLMEWAQLRAEELADNLQRQGGGQAVISALENEIARREDAPDATEQEEPQSREISVSRRTPSSVLGKKGYDNGAMKFLREGLSGQQKARSSTPQATSRGQPAMTEATLADNYEDVDDIAKDVPGSPLKNLHTQIFTQNKENRSGGQQQKKSFVDPQENGERVEWDEGTHSQSQSSRVRFRQPRNLLPPEQQHQSPRKRRREAEVEDPSEDEGFEYDNRRPASNKRVRVAPPEPSRQRTEPMTTPAQQDSQSMVAFRQSSSVADTLRKNPGQLVEPVVIRIADGEEPPPMTPAENYRLANQTAKMYRHEYARAPRERRPWTQDEINTLIDLIAKYGCSYAYLKQCDTENVLGNREQVDLRDKARNIKVDYLRARIDLPKNFEYVNLDRKLIQRLERYGVQYDQPKMRASSRYATAGPYEEEEEEVQED